MIDFEPSARIVSERELGERFEEILAELREQGETALITRHGKIMARLVPIVDEGPLLSAAFASMAEQLPSAAEVDAEPSYPIEQLVPGQKESAK